MEHHLKFKTIPSTIIGKMAPAFLLSILLLQCLYFAWGTGQTVDETFYSGSAYPIVRYNNYEILGEHPPLMMQLGGLPLLFLQPKYPIDQPIKLGETGGFDVSKMGSKFLYRMGNDAKLILFLERVPITLLTVILGWVIYKWALELYGWVAAMVVLALYSFCPNVIAHGSQFTTDLGVSAFFTFALYRLKRFFEFPSSQNAVIVGFFAGLALLSKMSGLALLPISFLMIPLFTLFRETKMEQIPSSTQRLDQWLSILGAILMLLSIGEKMALIAIGPIFLTLIWLVLRQRLSNQSLFSKVFRVVWFSGFLLFAVLIILTAKKRPPVIIGAGIVWVMAVFFFNLFFRKSLERNRKAVYLIKNGVLIWFIAAFVVLTGYTNFYLSFKDWGFFHDYVRMFHISSNHSLSGHSNYVVGSWIAPDWKYFISAMLVKTPLVTLFLFLLGLFILLKMQLSSWNKMLLYIPLVTFLLLASLVNRIYIGVRHILPIYPFVFLIAAAPIAKVLQLKAKRLRIFSVTVLFLCLGLSIGRTVRMAPHYLTYFNEWVGDVTQGVTLLRINDCQDNRRLAEVVRGQKIGRIKIASTCSNPDEYDYYGLDWSYVGENDFIKPSPGHYALDLEVYRDQQKNQGSWFEGRQPIYRVGKTFYLFEVK